MRMRPGIVVPVAGLAVIALAGCGAGGGEVAKQAATTSYSTMSVEELHDMMPTKDFVLVNVHTPHQGDIPGTDLRIPYDEIAARVDELPAAKDARIVLYCRSGHMSTQAAETLAGLGYTNVYDLAGGLRAWANAGY